ncbi:unnamed protein product [Pleuronectes platessa]|uniref:Uncharacterized protein n=1 Tax=Pleuronectes platessa TaxID=8262 RepID=A0A9N7YNH8_PLEPL|nr:unnamed protein product [Pleuronectes platessa]
MILAGQPTGTRGANKSSLYGSRSPGSIIAGPHGSQAVLSPPDVSTSPRLPSCCRLSEEGVDPGDLSLLPAKALEPEQFALQSHARGDACLSCFITGGLG